MLTVKFPKFMVTDRLGDVYTKFSALPIGYEDGITPVLAQPETPVPNGTRAC